LQKGDRSAKRGRRTCEDTKIHPKTGFSLRGDQPSIVEETQGGRILGKRDFLRRRKKSGGGKGRLEARISCAVAATALYARMCPREHQRVHSRGLRDERKVHRLFNVKRNISLDKK